MRCSRRLLLRLELIALAAVLALPTRAQGDGAFPDEFSIHFPPDAPQRIYLGANFGMLVSEDNGQTWRYACEPWVVAGSNAALAFASVSLYQVTKDGALLGTSINVTRSSDVACTWPTSGGSIAGKTVSDLFPDPNDASFVLAIVVSTNSSGSFMVASHDGGQTFDAPHLLDTADLLTSVEISRSTPGLVYATSVSTTGGSPLFYVSTNSGATWTQKSLSVANGLEPRILAVDPADSATVYLRLIAATNDSIAMTSDGGNTFSVILPPTTGQMSSFLRAGDGTLYAGTRAGKLFIRPPGAAAFSSRDAPHLRCLGQRPGETRIYACVDIVTDGYSLAYTDDQGATYHRVMSFTDLLGPLTCAPVQTNCAAHWSRIKGVLGITTPDGGTGTPPPKSGGSCETVGAAAWAVFGIAAFLWGLRRRRSRA